MNNPRGYNAIHMWLSRKFGKPLFCEKCGKKGFSPNRVWNIHWALIKGKEYDQKRENFIRLCNKCHRRYDDTEIWHKNLSKSHLGKTSSWKGQHHSKETRLKISQSKIGKKRPDVGLRNVLLKTKSNTQHL